jgi:outer membrane protein assembly factor BamB
MKWIEYLTHEDGSISYGKVSEDGKIYLTAVKGFPELDAYIAWVEAGNNPDEFWTQTEL